MRFSAVLAVIALSATALPVLSRPVRYAWYHPNQRLADLSIAMYTRETTTTTTSSPGTLTGNLRSVASSASPSTLPLRSGQASSPLSINIGIRRRSRRRISTSSNSSSASTTIMIITSVEMNRVSSCLYTAGFGTHIIHRQETGSRLRHGRCTSCPSVGFTAQQGIFDRRPRAELTIVASRSD
ncbi:uncharacterized protein B0H18DRAFT_28584 [Fomitopsis serialis]|uniref:uncharacterized protein n=1 Tax=Fomitopsis serialis TaxID=139415 RepID=UPI002008DFDC|nr:uncharacterized protein B0H18DRAFT_28584 [Neoantrodia serialis]KAH9932532.1 hypothetical protein B0H18DRAFT_28584 [Neoantrodia serialis]